MATTRVVQDSTQLMCAGAASMHDLTCLLNGAALCSLAAVSAAVPCPGLPDERHLAEARDHRTRHRPDSPSSRPNSKHHHPCCWSAALIVGQRAIDTQCSVQSVRTSTCSVGLLPVLKSEQQTHISLYSQRADSAACRRCPHLVG